MEDILKEIGLSENEAAIYLALLKKPFLTAQHIAEQTDIKRTNVYRLLDNLQNQGIVRQDDSAVKKFSVAEPQALQQLLQQKQLAIKQASLSLSAAMPHFRSEYSLAMNRPGVVHMAGTEGFERLLRDMAQSTTEVLLVASSDQPTDKEVLKKFEQLLHKRRANGISTRALFHDGAHRDRIKSKFTERGFDVRFIGTTPFKGEVVLYEDNTVFTVYDPSLIVTIVTNQHITNTMRSMFEMLWSQAHC